MSAFAVHDPDALIRHRAIRVTIAVPAVFGFGVLVLDNDNLALFGAFGAFALLAFADFSGSTIARTRAYLWLVVVGIAMIAIGTAASPNAVAAALLMAAIAFAITLAGVFGGYFGAGGPAALLLFVVAVMVPVPFSEVLGREAGWLLASAVAVPLATWLWPAHERLRLRLLAADLCDALAARLRDESAEQPDEVDSLQREVATLRDRYSRSGMRPAGPSRRDQALVRLLDQLPRAVSFATAPTEIPAEEPENRTPALECRDVVPVRSEVDDDRPLTAAVAETFVHTAGVLRGTRPARVGAALVGTRARHEAALERWVASALRAGQDPASVARRLERTFEIRVLSHTALSCEGDAVLAVGGSLPETGQDLRLDTPRGDGSVRATIERAGALLRPHLRLESAAFRNAVRAAVALSAALVVAILLNAEHGFWVVLGTVTVLKSSAMRTGISAAQALIGNLIGFALAGLAMAVFGGSTTGLWIALPVTVFLAAYAPAAIHFVVGQASFTLFVVVLFNILQPDGWHTGLIRVESVAVGAAVSLVVGVVLWPRGDRNAVRIATAAFYRSVAAYLDAALKALVHPSADEGDPAEPDAVRAAGVVARDAELTAEAAFFDLLAAPTSAAVPVPAWNRLTNVARSLRLVADGLRAIPARSDVPLLRGADERTLVTLCAERAGEVAAVADRIDDGTPRAGTGVSEPPLTAWLGRVDASDDEAIARSLVLVWTVEWLRYIDTLVALDDEPVGAVSARVDVPWWT